jgi:hypothetical protein
MTTGKSRARNRRPVIFRFLPTEEGSRGGVVERQITMAIKGSPTILELTRLLYDNDHTLAQGVSRGFLVGEWGRVGDDGNYVRHGGVDPPGV